MDEKVNKTSDASPVGSLPVKDLDGDNAKEVRGGATVRKLPPDPIKIEVLGESLDSKHIEDKR